jgi:phosphate transport system permease protein
VKETNTRTSSPGTPAPEAGPGRSGSTHIPLSHARLPGWAPLLVIVLAGAGSGLLALSRGYGFVAWAVITILLYIIALPLWSRLVENARAAKDRLVTALVWAAFGVALVPLVALVWQVLKLGAPVMSPEFLTFSMRNIIGEGGGIYHAIMGTLLITLGAAVISVPVGILAAIYLVEYGARSQLARWITVLVDVMTGIPSIVAGLFAYALFVIFFGAGVRMGFGGSVALSLLMIPIVVRSTEEMLKLVPHELREASYALGVPKWRTVVKVVLPTALAGIITGVTLAIARVVGETAPLLIIAGNTDSVNFNLFGERMMTLPVFIYYSYTQPGVPPEFGIARAWGAALVLIVIVMALNLLARVIGRRLAPKTGR